MNGYACSAGCTGEAGLLSSALTLPDVAQHARHALRAVHWKLVIETCCSLLTDSGWLIEELIMLPNFWQRALAKYVL